VLPNEAIHRQKVHPYTTIELLKTTDASVLYNMLNRHSLALLLCPTNGSGHHPQLPGHSQRLLFSPPPNASLLPRSICFGVEPDSVPYGTL
jgi:hypothetical protein